MTTTNMISENAFAPSEHQLLRHAEVKVEKDIYTTNRGDRHPIAVATINDRHHVFPHTSRISKALHSHTPEDIADTLTGGHFFFIEDQLVDFRNGNYQGFVHSDDSIDNLIDQVGVSLNTKKSIKITRNSAVSDFILGSQFSDEEFDVIGFEDGGRFSSELHFGWNPFARNINSAYKLIRLICLNGMVGVSTFMNTKIPLVNRWQEHMEISSIQIQNKVNAKVRSRMAELKTLPATISEVNLLHTHARNRLKDTPFDSKEAKMLVNIRNITDTQSILGDVYSSSTLTNANSSSRFASHLNAIDAFNIATEMRTHTRETSSSTSFAIDTIANNLLFSRNDAIIDHSRTHTIEGRSADRFHNADNAFFGLH